MNCVDGLFVLLWVIGMVAAALFGYTFPRKRG